MVKSVEFFLFFFQSYSKCLSDFFLRLGQTICLQRTTKKALFLRFLHVRCLLITYFIFPWVWKKIIVWKKSWILDPKICTNPVAFNPQELLKGTDLWAWQLSLLSVYFSIQSLFILNVIMPYSHKFCNA